MKRLLVALTLVLLAAPPSASAQQQNERELQRLRRQIESMRKSLGEVTSRAKSVEQELAAIEMKVLLKERELQLAIATKQRLETEKQATLRAIAGIDRRIVVEKRQLSARLRQLYKLGGLSYFRALVSLDSQRNPFQAAGMLSYLVNRDARDIARFRTSHKQLAIRQETLARQESEIAQAMTAVGQQQRELTAAQSDRQRILSTLKIEQQQGSERLALLEEKARRLERLMNLLYQQQQQTPRQQPKQGSRISDFRGALDWPVRGPIAEEFGRHRSEKFATYTNSNGVKIAVAPNTQVHAVFSGTVLFAQWFKGYGNLIIIDHGDRIFTLYGNTRMSMVKVGDRVVAGQPIATANENEDGDGGHLYFEVRENNKPVNPRTWLR